MHIFAAVLVQITKDSFEKPPFEKPGSERENPQRHITNQHTHDADYPLKFFTTDRLGP